MSLHKLRSRRLRRAGLAAIGAGAALLALAPAAGASLPADSAPAKRVDTQPVPMTGTVPAGYRSWDEVMAVQERLGGTADRIGELAEGPDGAGFGAIAYDLPAAQIRLYWKGALPASVSSLLGQDTAAPVAVLPAAYTAAELDAEVARITVQPPAGLLPSSTVVTGAAPEPDASGVHVFVNGSAADGSALPVVRAASVPVTVEGGVAPQTTGRADDWAPYYGGGRWSAALQCSTGFAIRQGTQVSMLSAAHCVNASGQTAIDGGGDVMGTTFRYVSTIDGLLIRASSDGRIFNGVPGVNEFTNRVIGRHYNPTGIYVCTSGALSGTICNIKVNFSPVTQSFALPNGGTATYTRLAIGDQQQGLNAGGTGDSGGPVFQPGSDTTTVWANGTVTGADSVNYPVPCTGTPGSSTRKCSSRVWYTSVSASLDLYGAQIVTS
jgi:hypothetical protein